MIKKIFIFFLIVNICSALEYKNKWICSYETVRFDTVDGDLSKGQYAQADANSYYIANPVSGYNFLTVPKDEIDISGMTEVKIRGKAYYSVFKSAKKERVRVRYDAEKYNALRYTKNASQPERIEIVDRLPEPERVLEFPIHHSIAYDAVSSNGGERNVSSISWSHTCTGSDGLLVVGLAAYDTGTPLPVTCTYNGDAVTSIDTASASSRHCELMYRLSPDTGSAYTISVTFDETTSCSGGAVSYTGVAQQAPEASNTATGTSDSPSCSVTTQSDNAWVFAILCGAEAPGDVSCSNTERWETGFEFNTHTGSQSDTNAGVSPAGAQAMSWSFTASGAWAAVAASFAEAGGLPPASTTPFILIFNF
jgi:hypothetical protein